jgi:uncharacterized protein YggT (Ycf19 family)
VYGMFYMACIHIALIGRGGIDYTPMIIWVVVFILRFFAWKKLRNIKKLSK